MAFIANGHLHKMPSYPRLLTLALIGIFCRWMWRRLDFYLNGICSQMWWSNIPFGLFITVWEQKLQKSLCQRVSLVELSEHLNPTGELAERRVQQLGVFAERERGKYIHHVYNSSRCNARTITDGSAWVLAWKYTNLQHGEGRVA